MFFSKIDGYIVIIFGDLYLHMKFMLVLGLKKGIANASRISMCIGHSNWNILAMQFGEP